MINLYIKIKYDEETLKIKKIKLLNLIGVVSIVLISENSKYGCNWWEFEEISNYIINE